MRASEIATGAQPQSHVLRDGTRALRRFLRSNEVKGENLFGNALGGRVGLSLENEQDARDIVSQWQESESHDANLLDTDYTEIGLGKHESGKNVVVAAVFRGKK